VSAVQGRRTRRDNPALRRRILPGVGGRRRPYTYCMEDSVENREVLVSEALETFEECELCGVEMFGLHCKLICPNCGYRRDCSDP
jgi:hypothetical protein